MMCDDACQEQRAQERAECYRVMERELDEAIALMIKQPIPYVVPDYDMSKPSVREFLKLNAAVEGDLWSSAPDFNGETP